MVRKFNISQYLNHNLNIYISTDPPLVRAITAIDAQRDLKKFYSRAHH